ncbi:MAG: hypothetical protein KGH60_01935 [Candidatus Micrarchaeota archaeon]|nr:hypothetical protein [Candidatus Micrarchaeota archaeon]
MQSSSAARGTLSSGHSIDEKTDDGKFTLAKVIDANTPTEFMENLSEFAMSLPKAKQERCVELVMYFAGQAARHGLYRAHIDTDMGEAEGTKYLVTEHPESKVKLPAGLFCTDSNFATIDSERHRKLGKFLTDSTGGIYPGYNACKELNIVDEAGERLFVRFTELLQHAGAHPLVRTDDEC